MPERPIQVHPTRVRRPEPAGRDWPGPPEVPARAVYLREARRLRARFRDRPGEMHRRLGELARRNGGTPHDLPPAPAPEASPANEFARAVEREFEGTILRPANRAALLRTAARMGIGRFEAHLLIAAVQHGKSVGRAVRDLGAVIPRGGTNWRLGRLAIFLGVEAVVAGFAWFVLRG